VRHRVAIVSRGGAIIIYANRRVVFGAIEAAMPDRIRGSDALRR